MRGRALAIRRSLGPLLLLHFALTLSAAADEKVKPIKALLVTGGCCHDYEAQKKILSEGISARAHVEWTIVHQGGSATNSKIPLYENADWAQGYDVVVHNECFADIPDPEWTQRVLKPHKEGLPAVVIHCAMHCYRDKTDEWFKFLGVTSRGHGANYPFEVLNLDPQSPIMAGFGDRWQTPAGELYFIEKLWPTAKPLGHAMSRDSKQNEVCIWTNEFDKTRVFGTTIGHHNSEMQDPVFLNYVTRGLLWAVDKLDERHLKPFQPADPNQPAEPGKQPTPALVPINLGLKKTATASSQQDDERSPARAVDGDPQTRWCANGPSIPQWLQVDLGKPQQIAGCRILWEFDDRAYQYKVEGSADAQSWKTLVDQTAGELRTQLQQHEFLADDMRYVRLTISGLQPGAWASLFEFEVSGRELVKSTAQPTSLLPRAVPGGGLLSGVKAPAGFEVSLFAAPPDIGYPTCLAAGPDGELYVGVDQNGSLDAKPERGSVVRCIDADGDGRADQFRVFARMDSPRGVHFDNHTLYVLHPPRLTAFHDDDHDGQADRTEALVEGIGFDLKFRGADHTTNGFRLAIDGYLYVAVGDYGFVTARGSDGRNVQLHGGGVVRVRTDGSGLEVVSRGQRNIYDVAVDPFLNAFTRDNTNDGGGWDVRLSQVVGGAQYGYPSRFVNFPDEIVQPLADYGGGSPCGALFVDDAALPEPFGHALYTCEWGRSIVYRHPLTPRGAGFSAGQEVFLELPRPTDIDIDARGRMYVASWRDGGFNFSGPNVGYVIQVRPAGPLGPALPDLARASDDELLATLASSSHVRRLFAQRELLRRGDKSATADKLERLANSHSELAVRVAAIFTLSQLRPSESQAALVKTSQANEVREFALRALADGPPAAGIPTQLFVAALDDPSPRVRLQALHALARWNQADAAAAMLPRLADADPLVAHLAVESLIRLRAAEPCLKALDGGAPELVPGCARVLQALHEPAVVAGLIERLARATNPAQKQPLLKALCRLCYREAEWKGDWWGTRPDTTGPYYHRTPWEQTPQILGVLNAALADRDASAVRGLLLEMARNKIESPDGVARLYKLAATDSALRPAAVSLLEGGAAVPDEALGLLTEVAISVDQPTKVRLAALRILQRGADRPAAVESLLRALVAVSKAQNSDGDLLRFREEFARDARLAPHVAVFCRAAQADDPATRELACMVLVCLANNLQLPKQVIEPAAKTLDAAWQRSDRTASLLRAIGLVRAEQHSWSVRGHLHDPADEVRLAAEFAAAQLRLDQDTASAGPKIAQIPLDEVLAQTVKLAGDPARGAQLFNRQGCVQCHTVSQNELLKGPFLGGIAARYSRQELAESILKPSAKIAQGFETQFFVLDNGKVVDGFVIRESGDEVELRGTNGQSTTLAKSSIDERGRRELSIMPTGLVDPLSPQDLASLLSYLESLKAQ